MYIAARNTFYDDLITLAGGTNACEQTAVKYPEISPESLRAMQPDLIIDIFPTLGKNPPDFSSLWKPYPVVVMTNSYAFIPGPRLGLLLEDFIGAVHPKNESK
jgi:ABC-type Fe3+-hydroxamate transport system substrate-binding protein